MPYKLIKRRNMGKVVNTETNKSISKDFISLNRAISQLTLLRNVEKAEEFQKKMKNYLKPI